MNDLMQTENADTAKAGAAADTALPRAELYLCLARLFEPRTRPLALSEWQALQGDLQALSAELALPKPEWQQGLATVLEDLADAEQAQVEYARLFLMPPAPAPLNLGYHRDGGQLGRTGQTLAGIYRQHGLERAKSFHDLDDHLSLNLQWLAWCWARMAEDPTLEGKLMADIAPMLQNFSLPACRQLASDAHEIQQQGRVSALWPLLLQLVRDALAADPAMHAVAAADNRTESAEHLRFEAAPVVAADEAGLSLDCCSCGRTFEADAALSTMIRQLHEAGLDTTHLENCDNCRHPDRQPATLTPPGARRFQTRPSGNRGAL